MPSTFDEFRKAFSYAVGAVSDRIVVPEHHNYQVHLARFLKAQHVPVEMERDFIDVVFTLDGQLFIGEIKVTTNLTVPQAFRTSLGQVIEYAHLLFPALPHMIIFLDQVLDPRRVRSRRPTGSPSLLSRMGPSQYSIPQSHNRNCWLHSRSNQMIFSELKNYISGAMHRGMLTISAVT